MIPLMARTHTCDGDDGGNGAGVGIAEGGSAVVVYDVLLSGRCSLL